MTDEILQHFAAQEVERQQDVIDVIVGMTALAVWLVVHYSTSNDVDAIHDQISFLWRTVYISADGRFVIRVPAKFFHFSLLQLSQFRLSDIVHSVNLMQYQQWSGAVALRRFRSYMAWRSFFVFCFSP